MSASVLNREDWLQRAVYHLSELLTEVPEVESVPEVRVSVGWPGGRGRKSTTIGQCWATKTASDGVPQVFVSPVLSDGLRVLDVLLHELVHAWDDCKSGHRGPFRRVARAVGLEGRMTATTASESLVGRLEGILELLGDYPHAALVPSAKPTTQTTRMLKAECVNGSGYLVRLTRKWLDEYGAPICPCHEERMVEG